MDKMEKIPIPEDVKKVLDNVSHILIGLNYKETARDYKQAVEKLVSLSEEPVQKFNTGKLQEIAKPATPHKKPTPEDRAKFMEELHEYAESKKPDKSLEEAADIYEKTRGFAAMSDNEECRRAFIAGAEYQAKQLLQGSPMPEDTVLFQKGVAEGRRLEREDSVECEVTDVGFNYLDLALFEADRLGLNIGDKVRIIIMKEEE